MWLIKYKFSQLDFSSLLQKDSWFANQFLANDGNMELSHSKEEDSALWKEFFDSIKRLDESENLRKVFSEQPERSCNT